MNISDMLNDPNVGDSIKKQLDRIHPSLHNNEDLISLLYDKTYLEADIWSAKEELKENYFTGSSPDEINQHLNLSVKEKELLLNSQQNKRNKAKENLDKLQTELGRIESKIFKLQSYAKKFGPSLNKDQIKKLVYICSPLRGNIEENIKKAIAYCAYAAQHGVIPLAPHTMFTKFLDDTIPQQREKGLAMGIELLKRCDEMWVCGGTVSQGMQSEIDFAKQRDIPINFISEADITQHILLEQETVVLKEKIREIQRESPIFYTRNDEGIVTSVILPEEAREKLKPEEITKIEDYIIRASSKSFDPEPTQIEEQSPDIEMQQ